MNARRGFFPVAALVAAVTALPVALQAQISITPMVGGYLPASNFHEVSAGAENVAEKRDGTLALGANLDLGLIRGTVMYASGTTIKDANSQNLGKGNVLAAAADLVIRPLPRILIQPYLLAGAGEKYFKYDQNANFGSSPNTQSFAWHGGVGADVMLGPIGVAAEVTDFLSKGSDSKWNVSDAFAMVGLKLRL